MVEVRQASCDDFNEILIIAAAVFANVNNKAQFNWPAELLIRELENVSTLVAIKEGKLLAFICYRKLPDEYEISVLATALNYQKQGLQTKIIQYLQGLAAKQHCAIILEVHCKNLGAEALYRKLGFSALTRRLRYYPDQADALVMKWFSNKAGC